MKTHNAHIIIFLLLFLSVVSEAEVHQLGIGLRGGVSALQYKAQAGGALPNLQTGLDIDYTFMSDFYVGMRVGVNMDYATSVFQARPYADQYSCVDVEQDDMDVSYTMGRLWEKHRQVYASLPVQLALAYEGWWMFAGPKFMFPLYMHRTTRAYNADLWCTYPYYESTVDEALALRAGLRGLQQTSSRENMLPVLWYALSLETGYDVYQHVARMRTSSWGLRVSVYADVAINEYQIVKTSNLSVLTLTDTRDGIPVERVLESVLRSNKGYSPLVQSYRYWACGVKLTFLLQKGERRRLCRTCHVL